MESTLEAVYELFLNSTGVCTDTRKITRGCLFFALKGAQFDANEFSEEAIRLGAIGSVIDNPAFKKNDHTILVKDVLECLQNLARHHRKQFHIPVIGLTGSNGKTTSKELIKTVLEQKLSVLATEGNLNNHIGVPLTLLKIKPEHQVAVIEMGANHQKEIDFLCGLASPTYGIITSIGKAHLEGFGGIEGIIKGKTELYRFLEPESHVVVANGDDELIHNLSGKLNRFTYGLGPDNDLLGVECTWDSFIRLGYRWKNEVSTPPFETKLTGKYNLYNLLAAVTFGKIFEVSDQNIADALSSYNPDNNRSQWIREGNRAILLDAYNANPTSVMAALENFIKPEEEPKLVFLGDMFELGEDGPDEHEKIVYWLKSQKNLTAYLCGPLFSEAAKRAKYDAICYSNAAICVEELKQQSIPAGKVLIKGSRGMKMEQCLSLFQKKG